MRKTLIACMLITSSLAVLSVLYAQDRPYSDPAKTIEAEASKDFSITLESNKTTGFGWDVAEPLDEKILKFISCEYFAADHSLAGSPGKEIWTFRALCPGKTSISFKYIRPWEKDKPPAKNIVFTVSVK